MKKNHHLALNHRRCCRQRCLSYLFYFGAKHKDPLKSASMVTVSATQLYDLYASQEDSANALIWAK
jgi:hypothetical protein